MARRQVQARVSDTMSERIDQYEEEGDFLNTTEALRSLLRAGLEAEGVPDSEDNQDAEDDQEVIADGGVAPARSFVRFQSAFGGGLGLLFLALVALGITPTGAPGSYLFLAVAAFAWSALTSVTAYTRLPELADAWAAYQVRRAADRLPFGGGA